MNYILFASILGVTLFLTVGSTDAFGTSHAVPVEKFTHTPIIDSTYESPRQQLKNGIAPQDIQCRNNHVLVFRDNDSVACVTEGIAERLGWEIVIHEDLLTSDGKIPNPTGYWVPIPEEYRKEFAEKLVIATGDSLTGEVDKYGRYITENGKISMGGFPIFSALGGAAVTYYLVDRSVVNFDDREKFIINFMDSMGFEYDKKDVGYNIKQYGNQYTTLHYSHEFSSVKFEFHERYGHYLKIYFNGWTNNPELVPTEYPLTLDEAELKLRAFIESDEILTLSYTDGGYCDFKFPEDIPGLKIIQRDGFDSSPYIIGGIPYYQIYVGSCTYNDGLLNYMPIFLIDAFTGEDIILTSMGGLD